MNRINDNQNIENNTDIIVKNATKSCTVPNFLKKFEVYWYVMKIVKFFRKSKPERHLNHLFIYDTPYGEDEFKIHTSIFHTLKKIILSQDFDKSLCFGLFGRWGMGKTFIVKMLEQEFQQSQEVLMLHLDCWKFDAQSLLRSILIGISGNLKQNKITGKAKFKVKCLHASLDEILDSDIKNKIFKANILIFWLILMFFILLAANGLIYFYLPRDLIPLFNFIALIPIIITVIYVLTNPESKILKNLTNEQFEQIYRSVIRELTEKYKFKKIVTVFDHLDRCEPEVAFNILSIMSTLMDRENCVYIVPCQDVLIRDYVNRKFNSADKIKYDQEYFDKIFNIQLNIPKLDEFDRNDYIQNRFKSISNHHLDEETVSKISQILYYSYKGLTPRQINRFVNDFLIYYYLAQDIEKQHNIKLTDDILFFTIMIAIKQKWQDFENFLDKNPLWLSEYSGGETQIKEFDEDLIIFLENVKSFINPHKPVRQYIYLLNTSDELDLYEHIDNRNNNIDLTVKNKYLIRKRMEKLYQDHQFGMLENTLEVLIMSLIKEYENIPENSDILNVLFCEFIYPLVLEYQKLISEDKVNHDLVKACELLFKFIVENNQEFTRKFILLFQYLPGEDLIYIKRPFLALVSNLNLDVEKRRNFLNIIIDNYKKIFDDDDYTWLVNHRIDLNNNFSYEILIKLLVSLGNDFLNDQNKSLIAQRFVDGQIDIELISRFFNLTKSSNFPAPAKKKVFNKFKSIVQSYDRNYILNHQSSALEKLKFLVKVLDLFEYSDIKDNFQECLSKYKQLILDLIAPPINQPQLAVNYIIASIILFNKELYYHDYYSFMSNYLMKNLFTGQDRNSAQMKKYFKQIFSDLEEEKHRQLVENLRFLLRKK
ncbi:MAG: KAP family P-loop NTPase fold protein [bacterium]